MTGINPSCDSNDVAAGQKAASGRSLEEIKAEARAFAFSGASPKKRKAAAAATVVVPSAVLGARAVHPQWGHAAATPWGAAVAASSVPPPNAAAAAATTTTTTSASSNPTRAPETYLSPRQQSPEAAPAAARQPQSVSKSRNVDDFDDDYARFVKVLGLDLNSEEDNLQALLDDDEDEFQLDPLEDEDDDDDDDDEEDDDDEQDKGGDVKMPVPALHETPSKTSTRTAASGRGTSPPTVPLDLVGSPLPGFETNFYRELEEELGWLEEEDMEAAVATLLGYPPPNERPSSPSHSATSELGYEDAELERTASKEHSARTAPTTAVACDDAEMEDVASDCVAPEFGVAEKGGELSSGIAPALAETATTPHRDVGHTNNRTVVTAEQHEKLRSLLEKHHQLLLQQAVLAVRAANLQRGRRYQIAPLGFENFPEFIAGGETAEDLVEILDGAVGMLQDLDQNRKDAIRYHIQFEASTTTSNTAGPLSPKRSLFAELSVGDNESSDAPGARDRRLTRAQFSKTLLEQSGVQAKTVFDIRGLSKLKATFSLIDRSVEGVQNGNNSILELDTNTKACEQLLDQSGAVVDKDLVPGCRDLSANFVDAKEVFGEDFDPPCSHAQDSILKKNRNLFTAGEDNLVLRGVNLYGEKQWILIADRFLPERSVNIISQRYAKLCFLLYKAHGIKIDKNGNLEDPPKFESVDDLDQEQVAKLQKVPPPAILNVHRWSIEEDLTLLKAVALMGSMWAELRARLIPHRDRGHLRKRYQVLERRVKATAARVIKHEKILAAKMRTPLRMHLVPTPVSQYPAAPQFAPDGTQAPSVAYPVVPVAKRLPPPVPRTLVPASKTATVKRSKTTREALPIATVKPAGAKRPSLIKTTKQTVRRSTPSETVNQAAAILANARIATPYHHPAYFYQPPPGYHPHMAYPYYPPYYPPGYAEEGSRVAFELLAHDPSNEWSQMSQMKKMMENETESMVASTIVTQLAKSPAKPPPISQMEGTSGANEESGSDVSMKPPARAAPKAVQSPSRSIELAKETYESPNKMKAPPSQATPARSLRYASPGTPMALPSPGIRQGFSPPSEFDMHHGSPSVTARTFPDGSSPFMYRHSEFSHNGHSMDGYDLNGVFSNAASESNAETETATDLHEKTFGAASLFADGAPLMKNDLEAVSALNLLKSPSKSFIPEGSNRQAKSGVERKSLFSKVVGSVKDKEKSGRKKRKINR